MIEPLPLRLSFDAGMEAFRETREQGAMSAEGSLTSPREFLKLGDGDLADDKTDEGLECENGATLGRWVDDNDELMAP